MDVAQASQDTGASDEIYAKDYGGRDLSAEDIDNLHIITGEENEDPEFTAIEAKI